MVPAVGPVDVLIRRAAAAPSETQRESALRRLRLSAEAATGLGAVVALLTIVAQAAVERARIAG